MAARSKFLHDAKAVNTAGTTPADAPAIPRAPAVDVEPHVSADTNTARRLDQLMAKKMAARPKFLEDAKVAEALLDTAAKAVNTAGVTPPLHCEEVLDGLLTRQAQCHADLDVARYPIQAGKLLAVARLDPAHTAAQALRMV